MILRRLLGALILLIALLGIGLSAAGTVYGHRIIDNTGAGLDTSLDLASQSLITAKDTLLLAKTTLDQVSDGLDSVETTLLDLSQTISQTQPLLSEMSQIVSHDVPDGVEGFQATVPDMAQAAALVDETLTTLSDLRYEQSILGYVIRFDLNLDYLPEVSLEESVNRVGSSLEDISPRLRALEGYIDTTEGNLETISQDFIATSTDLNAINSSISDTGPLLDGYVRIVSEVLDLIAQTRAGMSTQLYMAKLTVTVVMVWLGLAQIAPLYLGWELATGHRVGR